MPKKKEPEKEYELDPENPVHIDSERVVIPAKEKLLSFRAVEFFSDGNLREYMEKYGYPVDWPADEIRKLPAWLLQRCINSGAELEANG